MAKHVLLNNVDHRDLRIITERSADYGDNVMYAITFPGEFRNLQAHYPIVFHKEPETGRFQPIAMFGFEEGENLFLSDQGWDAGYIPLTIERQPFLIGFQGTGEGAPADRQLVIHIDMANPRVSTSRGEAVFLEHGGISEYLDHVNSVLGAIHHGIQSNGPFIDALVEYELLESFTFDVELDDGSEHRLAGFYTIHEERLDALPGDALARLNEAGYLKAIYLTVASLSRLRTLVEKKNALSKPTPETA